MKKAISIIALALALTMMMSVAAFAADGFVVDPAVSTSGKVTATAAGDDINVVIANATTGAYYGVLLTGEVAEGSYPTVTTPIYYINQDEAPDGFVVKPIVPDATTPMTLFVSTNADEALVRIPVSYVVAPANDYITTADTTKGTIAVDVKNGITDASMGAAVGNNVISLALDTTAYPNAGQNDAGYIIVAVNTDGTAIEGANVYYSVERKKYVSLIPTTVADYKFEVLAADAEGATANEKIVKYGDVKESNGTINIQDLGQFRGVYKKLDTSVAKTNAKLALVCDVTGDGKVNIQDLGQFRKLYKKQDYTFGVLDK